MKTQHARQNWFLVYHPDGIVTRLDAISLIRKHADKDLRRLMMPADLSDAQIQIELPGAWRREHNQRDMFRDAALRVANDENYPPDAETARLRSPSHLWGKLKSTLASLFV